jgi:hypothetical protein
METVTETPFVILSTNFSIQGMSEGPVLPQELLDLIVDHLFDDLESLRACALVSSNFLPSSRTHIFSHLRVGRLNREHSIDELHDMLVKSPGLACRIQSLHLWDNIKRSQSWLWGDSDLAPGVAHLSRTLPALRRFCITIEAGLVHWANIAAPLRDAAHAIVILQTLTSVELAGLYGLPFTLLAHCPALTSVALKWVTFDERDTDDFAATLVACAGASPAHLTHLALDLDQRVLQLLKRWLLLPQCPLAIDRLASFACVICSVSDQLIVQELLAVCATTLEHLELPNRELTTSPHV